MPKKLIKKAGPKSKGKIKNRGSDAYHHGDLKQALLDAALKFLIKHKPSEISLRDLARSIGVSQAAPYRHFKSKDALMIAISIQGFQLKRQMMLDAIAQHPDSARDALLACGVAYFKMGLRHSQHFKLMCSEGYLPSRETPELLEEAISTISVLHGLILKCQKAHVLGKGDPHRIAINCWSMVHGFTSLYTQDKFLWMGLTEKMAENALRTLLIGYVNGGKNSLDEVSNPYELFTTPESVFIKSKFNI